jgi:hypothetical protein
MTTSPQPTAANEQETVKLNKVKTLRCYKVLELPVLFSATDEYIASKEPTRENVENPEPSKLKKVIYLDIDNCLVAEEYDSDVPSDQKFSFSTDRRYYKTIRPGCRSFIIELKKWYQVRFFTSANTSYAEVIGQQLDASCIVHSRNDLKGKKNTMIKPLDLAFRNIANYAEREKAAFEDALLFDDDPFYAEEQFYNNVITVANYDYYDAEVNDHILLKYLPLLQFLAKQESIQDAMSEIKQFWYEKKAIEFLDKDPMA